MQAVHATPDQLLLVSQLRSARDAVGAARLAGDPAAEAMAHARVHSVKVALGCHEESWWEHGA